MQNYEHIELSEEEVAEALRQARKAKHFREQELRYQEALNRKPEYPKLTARELYQLAMQQARQQIPAFRVDDGNREIVRLLALYFAGDPAFEEGDYRLNKGILLLGPVGCGKTSLMRAFALNSHNAFAVVSCRRVSDDYSTHGAEALKVYSALKPVYPHQYFGQAGIGYCFDDLGTESSRKHYGNEMNVMADIILNRYEQLSLKGKTHFTANLDAEQIGEQYGSRVRSRLREMCNVIAFDGGAADRRG